MKYMFITLSFVIAGCTSFHGAIMPTNYWTNFDDCYHKDVSIQIECTRVEIQSSCDNPLLGCPSDAYTYINQLKYIHRDVSKGNLTHSEARNKIIKTNMGLDNGYRVVRQKVWSDMADGLKELSDRQQQIDAQHRQTMKEQEMERRIRILEHETDELRRQRY